MVEFKLNPFKLNKSSIFVPVLRAMAYKPSPLTTVYVPPVELWFVLDEVSSLVASALVFSSLGVLSSCFISADADLEDNAKTCPG